jgi:signal transduction histidine kinase
MLKFLERRLTLQLLVFYCLFVLPLLLGGIELYIFQRDAMQQNAQQADLGLAQAITLDVASHVQAAVEEDQDLARTQAAQHLDRNQLMATFASAYLSHPDISLYFVCDPSGTMIMNYPPNPKTIGQNFRLRDDFQGALHSDKPFVSSGRISVTSNTNVVSIATRIINDSQRTVGVMIINLSLDKFSSRLMVVRQQFANSGEVRIWIADGKGRPVADTENVPPETNLLHTLPGLSNALAGKVGSLIQNEQGRDWLYSYVPVVGTSWAVVVQRPTDVAFATLISFQNSLLIALVMLVVGATFFWFVMHGWVVAPLTHLAQAVTKIRPDQSEKVTDSRILTKERFRIDEIGQLLVAFSAMEDDIHTLFRKSDAESQARLQTLDAIMRSMEEGVLLESPDRKVVYANTSFRRTVGITQQDLLSGSFDENTLLEWLADLLVDPEAYDEAVKRAEDGHSSPVVAFQIHGYYNAVGQFVPVRRDIRMRLFSVYDLAGTLIGHGKIFQDVTQQNQAEQVKKNLLAIVSHELRTPLTAIQGYASGLLETDVEWEPSMQQHCLRQIVQESNNMAELVTNLLEMSQVEAGTLRLYPALYGLNSLLDEAIVHAVPEEEREHIAVNLPANVPLLYVDGKRMQMVFRNLLENAQKYADAHVEISVRHVQEPTDVDLPGLYLYFADDGPGIPAHLTESIFDRFYQIDGGRERSSSGVGLGLAICRGFIEAHGGRIWAENRSAGKTGALFSIWLPPKLLRERDVRPVTQELPDAIEVATKE